MAAFDALSVERQWPQNSAVCLPAVKTLDAILDLFGYVTSAFHAIRPPIVNLFIGFLELTPVGKWLEQECTQPAQPTYGTSTARTIS